MCERSNLRINQPYLPSKQKIPKYITCRQPQDSMAQIISNCEGNKYKHTHQEITTWQRLYASMNKTKDKRNEVEAKTTKRTVAE